MQPALAVEPATRRAFVIEPEGTAVELNLRTLAATRHELTRPVSALTRLHDWLEPKVAAKVVEGPSRSAVWLGDGLLAVAGEDAIAARNAEGRLQMSTRPAGLDVIDTRNWSARTLSTPA